MQVTWTQRLKPCGFGFCQMMLNASGGKVMGQVEKLVETKANATLLLAICGVGTRDCTCVLLHLIA